MYRTHYPVVVLSEEPIPEEMNLATILYECDEGAYVLDPNPLLDRKSETLTDKQMADALTAAGSDPSFFQLDDAGNKVEV